VVPLPFKVEPGHVMAFTRAVGGPGSTDSPPEVGTPAPPTFVAVDVQFDPEHMRDMRPAGVLAGANPDGGSVLHAEQEFEYFTPVRVGDVLTMSHRDGRTWGKQSRGGGELRFREILKEYRNPAGELVVRSRMVLVETGPQPAGDPECRS
jgi:hypothetical protein